MLQYVVNNVHHLIFGNLNQANYQAVHDFSEMSPLSRTVMIRTNWKAGMSKLMNLIMDGYDSSKT
jgi:hypothetical protein